LAAVSVAGDFGAAGISAHRRILRLTLVSAGIWQEESVMSSFNVATGSGGDTGAAPIWQVVAILLARLIFAAVFAMAVSFKLMSINGTAGFIAAAGFPMPLLLAWAATFFELLLVMAFLTGAYFSEAALLAAAYVLFLAFAFHGPRYWSQGGSADGQAEFGFFVDHFTFIAGLLFAAVQGPGRKLALRYSLLHRA
jgi:uncharacterized membrane protein YphA (DoxX/SURF4 family)